MKQINITFSLLLFVITMVSAQPNKGTTEKIETFQVAFFTQQLDLTSEEAKAFWPIYEAYQTEQKALKSERETLHRRDYSGMSDKELDALIEKRLAIEQKKLDLEKQYYTKFKKILPLEKVVKLPQVERAFKSALLKKMGEQRTKKE